MKKLFLVLFALVGVFGLIGCNNGGSEIEIDLDELIGSPSNLIITGTTLNWDAVQDADGYIIFANGEEIATVSSNSYNFSSMTEDRIIFQVQTKAPRGMQDSTLSISIAYVANKETEILEVQTAMTNAGMDVSEEFATELVNKGMLGEEAESTLTAIETFMNELESIESVEELFEALNTALADIENIEAIVSAVVKTYLPEFIEAQIDDLEDEMADYQWYVDNYPEWSEYYQESIDELQMQIDALNDLLDQIEEDSDGVVLAITSTIEYFISIEQMISEDLIDTITSISEAEGPDDLNPAELAQVTEEMANILLETMPSQEDILMIMEVYQVLVSISGSYVTYENPVDNYLGKTSAKTLYSLEAYIRFLESLDEDFFTEMLDFLSADLTDEMAMAEVLILAIKQFAEFKNDNQTLLDTISEVFTDEEKEQLYDSYIESLMGTGEIDTETESFIDTFNFQDFLYLEIVFEDSFDVLLDAFVQSDGEIIRLMVIMQSFERDWGYYDEEVSYHNYALDEEYEYESEYELAQAQYSNSAIGEVIFLLEAVFGELSNEDYNKIVTYLAYSGLAGVTSEGMFEVDLIAIQEAFDDFMEASDGDQLDLIQNLLKFIVDEDVFDLLNDLTQQVHDYYVSEFGIDYTSSYDYYMDDYDSNANLIFMADLYDSFMNSTNRGLVDDILEEVFVMMLVDDIQSVTELTDTEIANIEDNVAEILDYIADCFDEIKDMDADDLSTSDLEYLATFQMTLAQYMATITE